jgi:hypothetical protein
MEEPIVVRYVFMALIAISDVSGLVVGTDIAIARRLHIPVNMFTKCLQALMSPDPDSNSKEQEGRRVVPSDGERGYQLVNYVKYRELKTTGGRRLYMRKYMQKRRNREVVNSVNSVNKSVNTKLANVNHTEAEAEAEAESEAERERGTRASTRETKTQFQRPTIEAVKLACEKIGLPDSECEKFFDYYEANGWRVGKNPMKVWTSALANWKRRFNEFGGNQHGKKGGPTYRKGFDRNKGTFNEGKAGNYDTDKLQAARELREQQRRSTEAAGGDNPVRGEP